MAGFGYDFNILDQMTDDDLMALADKLGINTAQFSFSASPVFSAVDQLPGIDTNYTNITIPEDIRNEVANIFQSQRKLGQDELRRQAIESAGSRGLNMTDTPIFDPLLRSQASLESQLRGAESQSLLSLAQEARKRALESQVAREEALLRRGSLLENARQFSQDQARLGVNSQRNFASGLFNFQNDLAQKAFENRLALGQGALNAGLNATRTRLGFNTGGTTTTPPNIGAGLDTIGRSLAGLNLGSYFVPGGLFGPSIGPEY